MKKIVLVLLTILAVQRSEAQAPDMNFENWVSAGFGAPVDPQGFASANVLVNSIPGAGSPSNPVVASKETTAGNFTQGTASMKLTTGKLVSNPLSGSGFNDTVGYAFSGAISIAGVKRGYPFVARPDGFSFSYKAQPMAGDSNYVYVYTFKGGPTRTIIAKGYASFNAASSSMTTASITLNYSSALAPDSAFVIFSASRVIGGKIGSTFYVDDAKFYGGDVSVFEKTKNEAKVLVYPNPASNFIQFTSFNANLNSLLIYDMTGKLIITESLENGKSKISTQSFNNGIYMYALLNDEHQIISTGKFTVNK